MERQRRALAKGPAAYKQLASAELAVRRETAALTRETNQNTVAMNRNERAVGRFSRGALAGSGALGGLGRSVAFASSTFLGGAGLAYAFTSTLKVAGDFQRSLNVLRAVTSGTTAQMEEARAKAVELGRDITLPQTSAKDAANAMTTLAKAGLGMKNAIAGSEGVLRLAAAAQIDVATAGGIAAKSITSFGLAATETNRVADIFANAANASIGEISDFSLALAQSSQVAKSWHLSIEETVATLATFAQAGIQGSDAGTSLRVMLSRLVPTSNNAAAAFEKLNVSAFDDGKIKPYRDIIRQLHVAFKGLTEEEQRLNVQMIFGQDAQRGAGIAILNTIKNYDTMLAKIKETGTAQKYAAEINTGYVGSLDAFRSAVETLQITIGAELLPTFTDALKSATKWINSMEESGSAADKTRKTIQNIADTFKFFKERVQAITGVLGGFSTALKLAFGVIVLTKLRGLISGFGGIATASGITRGKVIADATAIGRALDIATRPRNVVITTTTTGIPGTTGVPGVPGAPGPTYTGPRTGPGTTGPRSVRDRINQYGRNPTPPPRAPTLPGGTISGLILGGFVLAGAGVAQTETGVAYDQARGRFVLADGKGRKISELSEARARQLDPKFVDAVAKEKARVAKLPAAQFGVGGFLQGRPRTAPTTTAGGGPAAFGQPGYANAPNTSPLGGGGISREQALQLAIDTASGTPGLSDDLRDKRALLSYYRQVEKNTKATGDDLFKIKQNTINAENAVTEQIAQIEAASTAAAKERAANRKQARDDRKQAEEDRVSRLREGFELRVARAAKSPGLADDVREQRRLIAFLKGRAEIARKTKTGVLAAESELSAAEDALNETLVKQVEREGKQGRAREAKLERAYRNQLIDAGFSIRNPNLVRGKKGGRQTEAGRALDKNKKDRDGKSPEDILDKARRERATAQNLRDEFLRIVAQFDSNVHTAGRAPGTVAAASTVVVNQHFNAPTEDRHREARIARFAAKAAFDG